MEEVCKNDLVMNLGKVGDGYDVMLQDRHAAGHIVIGHGSDKLGAVQQAYSTLSTMLVGLGLQCVTTTQAPFLSCAIALAEKIDGQELPF